MSDEKLARKLEPAAVDDRAPFEREPLWRILFVTWIYDIVKIACGRDARKLDASDCFSLGRGTDARNLSETWLADYRRDDAEAAAYRAGLENGSIKPTWRQRLSARMLSSIGLREPGLMRFLVKRFGARLFFRCALPLSFALGSNLAMSLLVKYMINRCRHAYGSAHGDGSVDPPAYQFYVPAAFIWSAFMLNTLGLVWDLYECYRIAMVARSALLSIVFKRAEAINAGDRCRSYSDGTLLSLLTGDVERITTMLGDSDLLFTPLGSILPAVPLLLAQLGYAAVPGLTILALAIPIQIISARFAYRLRAASTAMTDKRMHLTHEVLGHVSAMKLQAWEAAYVDRIHGLRSIELRKLRALKLVSAATSASFAALPVMASLATFTTFALTRSQDVARDPGSVFLAFMRVRVLYCRKLMHPGSST